MEAVTAQAALPGVPGQRQQRLDVGDGVVEAGVEAGHLQQARVLVQQDVDGFQREGLVERCQRDIAAQVFEHAGVHAHRFEVPVAAVHHAVRDQAHAMSVQAGEDAFADQRQRVAVRARGIERDRERRDAAFAEVGLRAADALHLAIPQRPARQRCNGGIEHRELDARRAAVEHHDEIAHGGLCR